MTPEAPVGVFLVEPQKRKMINIDNVELATLPDPLMTLFISDLEKLNRGRLLTKEEETALGQTLERARVAYWLMKLTDPNCGTPQNDRHWGGPTLFGTMENPNILDPAKLREEMGRFLNLPNFSENGQSPNEMVTILQPSLEEGEAAFEIFCETNLRLVVSVAKKVQRNHKSEMKLLELCQEGIFGLIRAVEIFDYRLDNRFSTLATWWIRQRMQKAIRKSGGVPVHMRDKTRRLREVGACLTQENQREPTNEEIAEAMPGSTPEKIGELKRQEATIRALQAPLSLELPAGEVDGDGSALGALIADDGPTTEEEALDNIARQRIKEAVRAELEKLKPAQRRVIELRFGEGCTFEKIGQMMGISKARAHQIFLKAIAKLRGCEELKELLEEN